jgi:hypothetical protein
LALDLALAFCVAGKNVPRLFQDLSIRKKMIWWYVADYLNPRSACAEVLWKNRQTSLAPCCDGIDRFA